MGLGAIRLPTVWVTHSTVGILALVAKVVTARRGQGQMQEPTPAQLSAIQAHVGRDDLIVVHAAVSAVCHHDDPYWVVLSEVGQVLGTVESCLQRSNLVFFPVAHNTAEFTVLVVGDA